MAGTIAPVIRHQFLTDAGLIASGYKLFSYEAGTTTKLATYSDADLTTPNANPIVLDAAGRATIFLSANTYKFVLAPSTDTDPPASPVWTVDDVESLAGLGTNQDVVAVAGEAIGIGDAVYCSDGSGSKTPGRWYKATAAQTYSSSAAYLVGMAPAAISNGATSTVRILGRVTGLSSLTAGSIYYVDASTPGDITATAPSNVRAVGFADSTTSLIVSPAQPASGSGGSGGVTGGTNLCADSQMLIWAAGDAAVPTHYGLAGTTPAVARCGTGLGDTTRKYGTYSVKISAAAGGAGDLYQDLLTASSFDDYFQGKAFSFGAWVKGGSASVARLYVGDGVGDSWSSYNTGTDWEFLTVTRTLDAAATVLQVGIEVSANQVAYVSGFTALEGSTVPTGSLPSPSVYGTLVMKKAGTLAASPGSDFDRFFPARPMIVKDVVLFARTAPTDDHIDVDVVHWNGSAWVSMFATRPEIAASANYGQAQPDGDYRYRCFGQGHAASFADGLIGATIEDVGSTIAGADLTVYIRCLQFLRPLEDRQVYNE